MSGVGEEIPEHYRHHIEQVLVADAEEAKPHASVVVVTYRTETSKLRRTLDALANQTTFGFEVVLIDNGHRKDLTTIVRAYDVVRQYVRLRTNYGVTFARNLGAKLACSDLLVFLDDDAVPRQDFVTQHLRAHQEHDIVAARGKVLPRTENVYNRLQWWYDLGDEPFPFCLNIEGNTSFDRDVFLSQSGFDEDLPGRAGHEGVELTYRLIKSGYSRDEIIYYPNAVIRHDVAAGLYSHIHKRIRNKRNKRLLKSKHPDLMQFAQSCSAPVASRSEREFQDRIVALILAASSVAADTILPDSAL